MCLVCSVEAFAFSQSGHPGLPTTGTQSYLSLTERGRWAKIDTDFTPVGLWRSWERASMAWRTQTGRPVIPKDLVKGETAI